MGVKKLEDITDLYQPKILSEKDLDNNAKYFVYGANGIIGEYNEFNHDKSTIAIACRGNTCGTINITLPFSWITGITGNAMVVKPKKEFYSIDFLYSTLSNSNLTNTISGSAQPQITRINLAPLNIVIPNQDIIENYNKINNFSFDLRIKNQI